MLGEVLVEGVEYVAELPDEDSGVVEPVGALLTLALVSFIEPVLPFILSFAAGAMIYVVVEELIPESQDGDHSNIATIGVAIGFALMMILDIALG